MTPMIRMVAKAQLALIPMILQEGRALDLIPMILQEEKDLDMTPMIRMVAKDHPDLIPMILQEEKDLDMTPMIHMVAKDRPDLIPMILQEEKDLASNPTIHPDTIQMIPLEEKDQEPYLMEGRGLDLIHMAGKVQATTPMILTEEKDPMTTAKDPLILMDAKEAMIVKEVAKVLVVFPALMTMLLALQAKITKTVDNGKEVVEAMEVVVSALQVTIQVIMKVAVKGPKILEPFEARVPMTSQEKEVLICMILIQVAKDLDPISIQVAKVLT